MNNTAHRTHLTLSTRAKGRLAAVRSAALPVREEAEGVLAQGREVVLDFAAIEVTQSFIDELVGALILRHGPAILERVVFKNCSDDTRAIIEFVATDRCDQWSRSHAH
ncbi:STAS-like domain-containing protein [uncultured Thiodictyon sp.]|uniref:STAS-like domain-containing protein n=1 Tax=uncultured Thiodictyon sp. TaxID=1846217 RepID=UPI0025F1EBE5|nr:STAS-like domain-containing protein [uncultured Thiodictyon sp.]